MDSISVGTEVVDQHHHPPIHTELTIIFTAVVRVKQNAEKHVLHYDFPPPGAGSKYRGEGGSFLWANTAICFQWDSNMFPPCSLLYLPKPTDSTSTPSPDRCCLTHQ